MATAASSIRGRVKARSQRRSVALPTPAAVAILVLVGFLIRALLGARHVTPTYLPDEYIYSELARSLARGDGAAIRGDAAAFPALLEPLLAAPLWIAGDVDVVYRLTQGLHALAAASAAVPVYLLARRLQLPSWLQLAAAALTLAFPALLYSAYVVADPVAYPLALASVYAGVVALDRPTWKAQLAFVVLAGMTSFARVQYVVLPLAFVAAAVVVERGRLRAVAAAFRPTLLALAVPAALVGAIGAKRLLGYYASVTELAVDPARVAAAFSINAYGLLWASGWMLAPAAAVAVFLGFVRPRSRAESAFAALFVFLALALLAEAAVYAANGELRFKERYLMALLPLIVLAFGAFVARGTRAPRMLGSLGVATVALAAAVPLPELLAHHGHRDSPFALGVSRLAQGLDEGWLALGGVIVAAAAASLNVAAARGWRAGYVVLVLASGTLLIAASAYAYAADYENTQRAQATYLSSSSSWIDSAAPGGSALLVTPGSPRELGFENLFWNRSIDDVLYLRGTAAVDVFRGAAAAVAPDGTLIVRGARIRRPLLVSSYRSSASFADAVKVRGTLTSDLWRPCAGARLSTLLVGRWFDGWLDPVATLTLYPSDGRRATARFRLWLPLAAPPAVIDVRGRGLRRRISLRPGRDVVVQLALPSSRATPVTLTTTRPLALPDGRIVAALATAPQVAPRPARHQCRQG